MGSDLKKESKTNFSFLSIPDTISSFYEEIRPQPQNLKSKTRTQISHQGLPYGMCSYPIGVVISLRS